MSLHTHSLKCCSCYRSLGSNLVPFSLKLGFRPWMSWVQSVYRSYTTWVSDLGCLGFKSLINLFQGVLHNLGFRPWMSWVQTVYTSFSGRSNTIWVSDLGCLGFRPIINLFRGSYTNRVSELGCLGFKPFINLFQEVLHNLTFRPWMSWVQTFYNFLERVQRSSRF